MTKRIGVLTGGGDCPGLNAVLRAVVKTAMIKYGWEVIGFRDGYRGLVLNDYIEFKSEDVSGILDKGGTILGSSNKDNPFKFKVDLDSGSSEYKDMSRECLKNIKDHKIDCMVLIGGDGTLTSGRDFARMGVNVVGVPKTIDNDLYGTDYTFGFMTAVDTATEAVDKLHSTAESHHRVMILEVMGRNAGWIALESGIAGGADVILIPEIPYDIDKVCETVNKRKKSGKHFSIIVVSEGARSVDGEVSVARVIADSPDPIRLGGIGNKIADQIENITGIETRVTVLGHLQRGGRPNPFDRILSTRYGVGAVDFINSGISGVMVALQDGEIKPITIASAVNRLKLVDPEGELVKITKDLGVGFGD